MRYVAGFMCRNGQTCLTHKPSPDNWSGKVSAVGGAANLDESDADAMARLFQQKTGLVTTAALWQPVMVLSSPRFDIVFFRSSEVDPAAATQQPGQIEIPMVASLMSPMPEMSGNCSIAEAIVRDALVVIPATITYRA